MFTSESIFPMRGNSFSSNGRKSSRRWRFSNGVASEEESEVKVDDVELEEDERG